MIISQVEFSPTIVNVELSLLDAIARPVEAHVHCVRRLLLDSSVSNSVCRRIVDLHGSRWLGPSYFFEGGSDGNGFLSVDEHGSKLCFGCGRGDNFNNLAHNEDKPIEVGAV